MVAGNLIVYDVYVGNLGPATASNARLTVQLPVGVEYVQHLGPLGMACSNNPSTRQFTCTQASMPQSSTPLPWLQLQVRIALKGSLTSTFTMSAAPTTSDPGSNSTSSITTTGTAMDCTVRPRISVTTANNGDGRLTVTVAVANPGSTTDRLERLVFGPSTNALIDIDGLVGLTGNVTHTLGRNDSTVTFYVRRAVPGAVTVPFAVVDHCATPWDTFVGGGATAF